MIDSSRAEVCSGEVPCLEGRRAEGDSFSTWRSRRLVLVDNFNGVNGADWYGTKHSSIVGSHGQWLLGNKKRMLRTAISKSTNFSANVLISLLKQNLYSPASFAVKTESSCRSLEFSMMVLPLGPVTV